jgi:ABC-type uncharacterized transport system fused permease/ATPase subunit
MRTEENNSFSVITVFGVTVSEITESVAQVTVWARCLRRPKMAVTHAVTCISLFIFYGFFTNPLTKSRVTRLIVGSAVLTIPNSALMRTTAVSPVVIRVSEYTKGDTNTVDSVTATQAVCTSQSAVEMYKTVAKLLASLLTLQDIQKAVMQQAADE